MTKLQEKLRHMRILERMMQPASKAGQNAPRITLRAESEADASALLRALASRSLTARRFRRI
jgi:hypothetical protein